MSLWKMFENGKIEHTWFLIFQSVEFHRPVLQASTTRIVGLLSVENVGLACSCLSGRRAASPSRTITYRPYIKASTISLMDFVGIGYVLFRCEPWYHWISGISLPSIGQKFMIRKGVQTRKEGDLEIYTMIFQCKS